jgi:hypothetical protein
MQQCSSDNSVVATATVLTNRQRSEVIWSTALLYLEHFGYSASRVEDHTSANVWKRVARHFDDKNCFGFSGNVCFYLKSALDLGDSSSCIVHFTNRALLKLLDTHLQTAKEVYYSSGEEDDE